MLYLNIIVLSVLVFVFKEEEEYRGRTDSNSPAGPKEAVRVARDEYFEALL